MKAIPLMLKPMMSSVLLLGAFLFLVAGCGDDEEKSLEQLALEVSPPGGSPTSSFTPPSNPDPFEGPGGDDTSATAGSLPIGGTQIRSNFPIGDLDYAAVNLSAGVTYEFFTTKLSPQSDTEIYLYDTNGTTQLSYNDDGLQGMGYSSRILYTAASTGTYFILVNPLESTDVGSYTLGALVFSDGDGDTYSPFFDCNDGNAAIKPSAIDSEPPDGIDNNCTGADALDSTAGPDAYEPDDLYTQAKPMALDPAHIYEKINQQVSYQNNARTLHAPGDIDYFSVTIPAFSKYQIDRLENLVGSFLFNWFEPDGVTPIGSLTSSFPSISLTNLTASSKTYYLSVESSTGTAVGWYVLYMSDHGSDADGDGFYSQDWAWMDIRDCDDNDATIFPFAPETTSDGIDSNCNGLDDT